MNDLLIKIEEELKSNFDEVSNSLQISATDEQIGLLKNSLSINDFPQELEKLYKWHNGQVGFYSLNQDDNRTFLPLEEVVEAWKFLSDPMEDIQEPWSKSWIPILYNGSGDYLVYETRGNNKGALLGYWHDDEDRNVEYENLEMYLKEVLKNAKV